MTLLFGALVAACIMTTVGYGLASAGKPYHLRMAAAHVLPGIGFAFLAASNYRAGLLFLCAYCLAFAAIYLAEGLSLTYCGNALAAGCAAAGCVAAAYGAYAAAVALLGLAGLCMGTAHGIRWLHLRKPASYDIDTEYCAGIAVSAVLAGMGLICVAAGMNAALPKLCEAGITFVSLAGLGAGLTYLGVYHMKRDLGQKDLVRERLLVAAAFVISFAIGMYASQIASLVA